LKEYLEKTVSEINVRRNPLQNGFQSIMTHTYTLAAAEAHLPDKVEYQSAGILDTSAD
jgi:hypothetical protein